MKYVKVKVEFIFECPNKATIEQIERSVNGQINTDLNDYWQTDDLIAQMVELRISPSQFIKYKME